MDVPGDQTKPGLAAPGLMFSQAPTPPEATNSPPSFTSGSGKLSLDFSFKGLAPGSVFGGNPTPSPSASSLFSLSSTSKIFGGTPSFGQTPTTPEAGTIFGAQSPTASQLSYGSVESKAPSVFGAPETASGQTSPAVRSTSPTFQRAFGGSQIDPAMLASTQSSAFGGTAMRSTSSVFGGRTSPYLMASEGSVFSGRTSPLLTSAEQTPSPGGLFSLKPSVQSGDDKFLLERLSSYESTESGQIGLFGKPKLSEGDVPPKAPSGLFIKAEVSKEKGLFGKPTKSGESTPTTDKVETYQMTSALQHTSIGQTSVRTMPAYASEYLRDAQNPSVAEFLEFIKPVGREQVKSLAEETRGQSDNELWKLHRNGRITASNFRSVVTRLETLKDASSVRSKDIGPIVSTLMGYSAPPEHVKSLQYGREMEGPARERYIEIQSKTHRNLTVEQSGLVIDAQFPFLGCSPDGLVTCCCGEGLLEIKCPSSIKDEDPRMVLKKLGYFTMDENDAPTLKPNHKYYAQVQGQLALTGKRWCDFFVYTPYGYFMERIYFNSQYWREMKAKLVEFFQVYIAEELLFKRVFKERVAKSVEDAFGKDLGQAEPAGEPLFPTSGTKLFVKPSAQQADVGQQQKKPALFGKQQTMRDDDTGEQTFEKPGRESGRPGLFGKGGDASGPQSFGKLAKDEAEKPGFFVKVEDTSGQQSFGKLAKDEAGRPGLFVKVEDTSGPQSFGKLAKDEAGRPGLFGKGGAASESRTFATEAGKPLLFGKHGAESEPQTFGTLAKEEARPGLFGKGSDEARKSTFKIVSKGPGAERTLFGKGAVTEERTLEKPSRRGKPGLFGRKEVVDAGFKPIKETVEVERKPGLFGKDAPKKLFGKPRLSSDEENGRGKHGLPSYVRQSSTLSDAARRSVKKSISIARNKSKDDDVFSTKTAIICQEVPSDCNNAKFLRRHFSKYGVVKKVFPSPQLHKATIHFETHEGAALAKRKGSIFIVGHPRVPIFFSQYSPKVKEEKKPQTLFGKPIPSSRSLFSGEADDELEAMRVTSEHDISDDIRLLQRPEESEDSDHKPRPIKTITSFRGSPLKPKQEAIVMSNIRPLPQELSPQRPTRLESLRSSPVRKGTGASQLRGVGRTASDRYNLLEERDKLMRLGIKRESMLEKAKAVVGSCPDMCPEKERYVREDRRRLSVFEMIPGSDRIKGVNPKVDHSRAVKEYSRSSADQDEPLPHELRPPAVLAKTMDYLVNNVMDDRSFGWAEWYDFLWNRTRGIRKDITQQHLCDLTAVDLVEKCVRFHIYCAERLVEEDMIVFDQKINNENLTKCLQTLKELYADLEAKQGVYCPNEAEFRSYMVLMNLNEGDTLREVQQLRDEVRLNPSVKFAIETYHALSSNNYIRFFKLVRRATFLQACILHRYFNQVRHKALLIMLKALHKRTQYPLVDLVRQLMFEDPEDASDFCDDHGLGVRDDCVLLNKTDYIEPEGFGVIRRAVTQIESKLQVSVGEVVNGGPLPPNVIPTPSNSFNDAGRFTGDLPSSVKEEAEEETSHEVEETNVAEILEKVAALPEKPMRKLPNEVIKEIARELFLEVIDVAAKDISREMMDDVLAASYSKMLADETCIQLARELSEEFLEEAKQEKRELELKRKLEEEERLRREKEEREEQKRRDEEARREAVKEQVAKEVVAELEKEFVGEESLRVAKIVYREVQEQLHEESKDRTTIAIADELTVLAAEDILEEVANEVYSLEIRKQQLADIRSVVELSRCNRYFKRWWKRYTRRLRMRTAMLNFPCAPSQNLLEDQVTSMLPWRPQDDITDDAFYIGKKARLAVAPPDVIQLKQKINMGRIDLKTLLRRLQHDRAWKSLDLVTLVGDRLVEQQFQGRERKKLMRSDPDLYWKILMVTPGEETYLSDWIRHKLKKGGTSHARNVRKARTGGVNVISLYSTKVIVPTIPLQARLHVCVSEIPTGSLSKDIIMGTSTVIGFICEGQTFEEKLDHIYFLLASFVDVPILVLTEYLSKQEMDYFTTIDERLDILSLDDVEKMGATYQLCQSLQWAAESSPIQPKLEKKGIKNFINDFLSKEFFTPVYQNLALRKKNGLPHQAPHTLIALYRSAVRHMADVAGSLNLENISWPALEFSCTNPDLPPQDWNSHDQLDFLEELILSVSLPPFVYKNDQSETWVQACQDIWSYVQTVLAKASGDADSTNLYSKIGWCIRRSREQFEETCFLAERLEDCEPCYINMPWTDIVVACVSFKLDHLDWVDGLSELDEEPEELLVHYLPSALAKYRLPTEWTEVTAEKLEQETTTTKDSVVRAVKRKMDETLETSVMKRTAVNFEESSDSSGLLDLSSDNQVSFAANNSAYELKSRLAVEKQSLDLFEKYLESVVNCDAPSLGFNSSWSESYRYSDESQLDTSGADFNSSVSNPLVNDKMDKLQQDLQSSRRADKMFELRLRSFLVE